MFKVTPKEELAVMKIEGVYRSLQVTADKVARTLLFDYDVTSTTVKKSFFVSKRRQKAAAQEELKKLLEVITILKAEFEACMPSIVGKKLCFKCRIIDENEFDTDRFCISEAKNSYDMLACFNELESRISKVLAFPEVANVVQNTSNYTYCPSFAAQNLGISQSFQRYLKLLKDEEAMEANVSHVPNPNTSKRKRNRHAKNRKNGKKQSNH